MRVHVMKNDNRLPPPLNQEERDSHIESGYINTAIHHLPPTSQNPSSLAGARENLRHVARCMGLRGFVAAEKEQRNNVVMYEDGGSYAPTNKVIDETFYDNLCRRSFDSKEEFISHWLECHGGLGINCINDFREFRDFLVCSGGGHMEQNARKSFLSDEFTYTNFVKPCIMATGFNEQQSRHQSLSSDNHK